VFQIHISRGGGFGQMRGMDKIRKYLEENFFFFYFFTWVD
jgi:hypothetical protein